MRAHRRFGPRLFVGLVTGVSVLASVAITAALLLTAPDPDLATVAWSLMVAAVVPSIVASSASILMSQLLVAVEEANERLRKQVVTDPLCGRLNRRGFFLAVPGFLADHADRSVVAGMVDLDDFKQVNDRHGHAVGDEVLMAMSARLAELLGPDAVVGRIGGDEFAFVVALPEDETVEQVGRRLHDGCGRLPIGHRLVASATVGLALAGADADIDDLLLAADHDLYANKERKGLAGGEPGPVRGSRAAHQVAPG